MDQVSDFFTDLFSTALWPARWYCGTWTDFHGWLYIISSLVICLACFLIPINLFYVLIKRKKDLPFPFFTLSSLFILSFGITHFFDAIVFWHPLYRLHALFLFVTAGISSITVIYMYKVLPYVLTFASPQQLEKVVQQRTLELAKKNDDLLKLNKEMDNFVYSTSHDLKSPINNISGLVNILKMEMPAGNASVDELLNRIESSSMRAIDSIQNLTGILKVHTEPYDDLETISIRTIVEEILEENTILVRKNQAIIRYELQELNVFFSQTALKSILYNLIINAIKYKSLDRQPEITIRSFPSKDKSVEIDVIDNGLGIDLKAYGEKVFCLFKRFHDHIDGSGIGLYTVKKIIESKGGSVSIESKVNVGSTFKLTLPQ
ncbi:MAG: HAMP domain-containing histidine kinase [Cytophagaceae bacterium]|nr:HAMP domain-containing histidine kinase [Cytophagaceae bacterium]